ncbi:MAG: hypothetical protein QG673_2026 [Pseudomonadota bacterium]|nr:hypothetical protein [Pseudomonadota bacterium]
MQEPGLIILAAPSGIVMSLDSLKKAIIKSIMDTVNNNQDQIISEITKQKLAMFDDNSHTWSPLLLKTVERKKRIKGLFREPDSINIRKGGLFKTFTNTQSYKIAKNNEQIDFEIELNEFDEFKTTVVAKHGLDVAALTQVELDQITENLTAAIASQLRQDYEK